VVTGAELKRRFLEAFSDVVLRHAAQHIHDAYPDSLEKAAAIDKEFRRRAIPQIRHFVIQSRMRYIPKYFPHVTATIKFSEGHEPYTVLRSNNFNLSVSMTKERGQLPRRCDFREQHAIDNLFEIYDPNAVPNFYAILTHVPLYNNSAPEHLVVLFPDDAYRGVYTSIDLGALIAFDLESSPTPSEDIDAPEPTLRKRLPKTQGEA
jgi:hypothetical protein